MEKRCDMISWLMEKKTKLKLLTLVKILSNYHDYCSGYIFQKVYCIGETDRCETLASIVASAGDVKLPHIKVCCFLSVIQY